ncbi:MAG TPA: hypothetical protein VMJ64_00945 [Anaerolineales bacterium]|nr:hypothetical protein [Anaerolineales bacterium]
MTKELRTPYEIAWRRLFDLMEKRNRLLRSVEQLAGFSGNFSPATSMYWQFDYDRARLLLASAERLEPDIDDAIEEVNALAVEAGRPAITKNRPS